MSWGLALSGGAACGLSNAGILDALEKEKLKPDVIAGNSMGAIIGALYALGYDINTLQALKNGIKIYNIARPSDRPMQGGLQGGLMRQDLRRHLHDLLKDRCLGDCRIPFLCTAGRLKETIEWQRILRPGFAEYLLQRIEKHVFGPEVRILDAIMASSAIPVLFSPVAVEGELYIDLCLFGAIPSLEMRQWQSPDIIIGTDTTPSYPHLSKLLPKPWHAFLRAGYESLEECRNACDLVITPKLPASPIRFDKGDLFWKAGEQAAEIQMNNIHTLLQNRS